MININNTADIMYGKETDEFMFVFHSLLFTPKYFSLDEKEIFIYDQHQKYFTNIPCSLLLKNLGIKSLNPYIMQDKITFVNLREEDKLIKEISVKVSQLERIRA